MRLIFGLDTPRGGNGQETAEQTNRRKCTIKSGLLPRTGGKMKFRAWLSISQVLTLATVIHLAAQERQNESTTTATANPIPLINQPLMPEAIRPAGAGFALTINGTGFATGSVVMWKGAPGPQPMSAAHN